VRVHRVKEAVLKVHISHIVGSEKTAVGNGTVIPEEVLNLAVDPRDVTAVTARELIGAERNVGVLSVLLSVVAKVLIYEHILDHNVVAVRGINDTRIRLTGSGIGIILGEHTVDTLNGHVRALYLDNTLALIVLGNVNLIVGDILPNEVDIAVLIKTVYGNGRIVNSVSRCGKRLDYGLGTGIALAIRIRINGCASVLTEINVFEVMLHGCGGIYVTVLVNYNYLGNRNARTCQVVSALTDILTL
jgi:hypothetical protein